MAQAAQAGSGLSLPAYSRGQGLHTRRCAPIHPEHMGATTRYHRAPSIVVVGRIYADFAQALIKEARALYVDDGFAVELDNAAYALDASTIDLCISLFPWAKFRRTQSAVKLHTLQDLRGNIPTLVFITDGKVHDVNILDQLLVEPGAFYIMDRGYLDFARLFAMHQAMAFFIIRAKKNFNCRRLYSAPVEKSTGVQCDQTVLLNGFYASKDYPEKLRRIRYFDADNDKRSVFLTNNFDLPAKTVADLYRCRWQVELFFKWIKQHLRIKKFLRHDRERGKDANLDCHQRVCTHSHRQEAPRARAESLHNSTDFERQPLREDPHFTGFFVGRVWNRRGGDSSNRLELRD